MIAHWNNQPTPLADLTIPVEDRAFFFGDAIYEVIRLYQGKFWLLGPHMQRLERSLAKIRIEADAEGIRETIIANAKLNRISDGMIYAQVSRGTAPRDHGFSVKTAPNILIYAKKFCSVPWQAEREHGIRVILREDTRWLGRDIKSVNLLPNCLAKQEANDAGADEAVFVEENGTITEATSNNVFMIKGDTVYTHPANRHILHGITREHTIGICKRLGIRCEQRAFSADEFKNADEAFITGTTAEVLRIKAVDNASLARPKASIYERIRAQFSADLLDAEFF